MTSESGRRAWVVAAVGAAAWLWIAAHPAAASLVAHWKLDETSGATTAVDSGQYGFDGTVAGTIAFGAAGANGNTGTSADFSNASINVAYDGMLNPSSFTMTAWAYLDTVAGSYQAVSTNRDDQGVGGSTADGFIIYKAPTTNHWEFWSGDGAGTATNWQVLSSGVAASAGAWTHLAISYDETTNTKSIYVNGSLAASQTGGAVPLYEANAHEDLHIGGGADDGTSFRIDGKIDDVTLWNESLSLTEIQAIMNNSTTALPQRLVASFDVGTDAAFVGVGPVGGPDTSASTFTKVSSANNPATGDNGATTFVFNGINFIDANSPGSGLTDDYVYDSFSGGNGSGNWEIGGLDPNAVYEVYIVAPDGTGFAANNIYGGDYTVLMGSADQLTLRATGGTTEAFEDFVAGRDYVIFTGVRADAFGKFAGTYNVIPGQPHAGIAGVQIVEIIPEPTTASLLVLGLAAMARRRRRNTTH